jgi:hypothetical protein
MLLQIVCRALEFLRKFCSREVSRVCSLFSLAVALPDAHCPRRLKPLEAHSSARAGFYACRLQLLTVLAIGLLWVLEKAERRFTPFLTSTSKSQALRLEFLQGDLLFVFILKPLMQVPVCSAVEFYANLKQCDIKIVSKSHFMRKIWNNAYPKVTFLA